MLRTNDPYKPMRESVAEKVKISGFIFEPRSRFVRVGARHFSTQPHFAYSHSDFAFATDTPSVAAVAHESNRRRIEASPIPLQTGPLAANLSSDSFKASISSAETRGLGSTTDNSTDPSHRPPSDRFFAVLARPRSAAWPQQQQRRNGCGNPNAGCVQSTEPDNTPHGPAGRGLQRLVRLLPGHSWRSQFPQFFVDQRQELLGGLCSSLFDTGQDQRHFGPKHGRVRQAVSGRIRHSTVLRFFVVDHRAPQLPQERSAGRSSPPSRVAAAPGADPTNATVPQLRGNHHNTRPGRVARGGDSRRQGNIPAVPVRFPIAGGAEKVPLHPPGATLMSKSKVVETISVYFLASP